MSAFVGILAHAVLAQQQDIESEAHIVLLPAREGEDVSVSICIHVDEDETWVIQFPVHALEVLAAAQANPDDLDVAHPIRAQAPKRELLN
jgi:small ligand-binding sensory domain FIST